MRAARLLALLLWALPAVPRAADLPAEPDLILHNGKVFIAPGRYAQAVSIGGGLILETGSSKKLLKRKGPKTRLVDLRGRAVTPGFHDAHVHFTKGAQALDDADLNGADSVAAVQERVLKHSWGAPGLWVRGRGWDHTAFPGRHYPTRQDIDAVVSTRPVVLIHVDGQIFWLNTAALRLAGITRRTKDPANGKIVRDASGEPTGILIEAARDLALPVIPKPGRKDMRAAALKALQLAKQNGVTAIQGPVDVNPDEELALWRELEKDGLVPLRYFMWGRIEDPDGFQKLREANGELPRSKFVFGGLKGFVDGVISARTAALIEPYSDQQDTDGQLYFTTERLKSLVADAASLGYQSDLHAIGDRAVRQALDACAGVRLAGLPACKIEHAELIDPKDLPRFKADNAALSMQPSHMTYDKEDQNYNPERLGKRVDHAFAWKSAARSGAILAFGTDWPVMPLAPRVNLFAATTREHFNGKPQGGWIPKERLSLEEAVVRYTLDPARAVGRAAELGSIEPGKRADLAVFDKDLFSQNGLDLLKMEVDMTVFDGKAVYERPGAVF